MIEHGYFSSNHRKYRDRHHELRVEMSICGFSLMKKHEKLRKNAVEILIYCKKLRNRESH